MVAQRVDEEELRDLRGGDMAYAVDRNAAKRLWTLSKDLLG